MSEATDNLTTGEFVQYMPHPGSSERYPAMVCYIGNDSIDALVYTHDGSAIRATPRFGVVHQSDPRLRDPGFVGTFLQDGDGGVFVDLPSKTLLLNRIAALERAVVQLAKGKKPNLDTIFQEQVEISKEPAPKPVAETSVPLPKMSDRFPSSDPSPEEIAAKKAALALAGKE